MNVFLNTISGEGMKKRFTKLWKLIGSKVDGMFITSPENVRYLCGFSGTEGSLLLTKTEGFFLTDGRYTTQAKEQVKDCTVITFKEKTKEISRIIKKLGIISLGFESRHVTVTFLRDLEKANPALTCVAYSGALDGLRAVKDAQEIRILKRAAAIAAESLEEIFPLIRPGVREIEIAAELEYRMKKKGGDTLAFPTIVASGYRSALPHGIASDKQIRRGEFVVIDYGVVYQGYASDETCTVVVGKPTIKKKGIYDIVKKAHDLAIKAIAPGKPLKKIDAVARNYIKKNGYEKNFNHGTGHGLGLNVHEPPVVSFRSQVNIQAGMVFTVEPGIYVPGWGGVRIEDTVHVTQSGCEFITRTDKKLRILEC